MIGEKPKIEKAIISPEFFNFQGITHVSRHIQLKQITYLWYNVKYNV